MDLDQQRRGILFKRQLCDRSEVIAPAMRIEIVNQGSIVPAMNARKFTASERNIARWSGREKPVIAICN
jgi:hypothetical protein